MDWWAARAADLAAAVEQYGLVAAFLGLLIDEVGVPMPMPSYAWPIMVGIQAGRGRFGLAEAVVTMELAAVVGATICYAISARAGRFVVFRVAAVLRLRSDRLQQVGGWLRRRGALAVVVGRLLPGWRILTAVACGSFGVPPRVFVPALAAGALVYIVPLTLLGYAVGPRIIELAERASAGLVLGWVALVAVALGLLAWWRRARGAVP
jgi:membrane protein DedA with SNARE-associated domain